MKKIFLLVMMSALLIAATGFWQQVIDIQQRFFNIALIDKTAQRIKTAAAATDKNTTAPDTNSSIAATGAKPDEISKKASQIIEEKYDAFNALIATLKQQPYSVQRPDNVFYSPEKTEKALFNLKSRIAINRQYGYTLAVDRDRITVETLKLKQDIYVFFASLAASWTDLETDALKKMVADAQDNLKKIPVASYEQQYLKESGGDSPIQKQIRQNLQELRSNYYFFNDILNYLSLNPSVLRYESLVQKLQLGRLINMINNNDIAAEVNIYLRYIGLDLGRLALFVFTLLLTFIASHFTYITVHTFLRKLILRKEDAFDRFLLASVDSIRKPIALLVMLLGFKIAFEFLFYPSEPVKDSLIFYFLFVVLISYIIIQIIDNTLLDYLIQRAKSKNREIRSELINLMISVLKFLIVLIALLIFLVHAGINISGILASLGIGGLAVALAAKETLSNFFGLIKIIVDNSMSQGDWIEADGIEGTVVEIGFVSTDIRTFDNALITVPNEKLANAALKNWNRRSVGRRIKMKIGVTYGSDREKLMSAIGAIRQMLIDHPGIATPEKVDTTNIFSRRRPERKLLKSEDKYGIKSILLVYLDDLGDSSINILVYCFTKTTVWQEWLKVKEDVIFKIWEILEAHGLEFAFPSQSLYFDRENLDETVAPLLQASSKGRDTSRLSPRL